MTKKQALQHLDNLYKPKVDDYIKEISYIRLKELLSILLPDK